jgi:hypothetical protein
MMIDLRYKNTPIFAISIAFLLLNTVMAEAAPSGSKIPARSLRNTPDEALRELVSGNTQQTTLPSPSGVFAGNDVKSSHQIATDRSLSSANPLDVIVSDITNQPTTSVVTQPTHSHPFAAPTSNQPVAVIPSYEDLKVVQPTQSEPQPTSTESAVTDRIESSAPFSFSSESAETKKLPDSSKTSGKKKKNNKAPQTQSVPQDTTETPQDNQEQTQSQDNEYFKAQPNSEATGEKSSDAEPFIINKSIVPDNTVLPKKFDLSSMEKLTNKLVSGSQQIILSIQSDSSARLFLGSTRLEIPPALGSRLMLETAVKPPQATTLSTPNSSALLAQTTKPSKSKAIRLLLTDRNSTVAFSVIGTHWFANKPNV